jgi:hypothetical protein
MEKGNSTMVTLSELQSKIGADNISESIQLKIFSKNFKSPKLTDFIINSKQILEIQNSDTENNYSFL